MRALVILICASLYTAPYRPSPPPKKEFRPPIEAILPKEEGEETLCKPTDEVLKKFSFRLQKKHLPKPSSRPKGIRHV